MSRLNDHYLDKSIENQLIEKFANLAPKVDGIVVSDLYMELSI